MNMFPNWICITAVALLIFLCASPAGLAAFSARHLVKNKRGGSVLHQRLTVQLMPWGYVTDTLLMIVAIFFYGFVQMRVLAPGASAFAQKIIIFALPLIVVSMLYVSGVYCSRQKTTALGTACVILAAILYIPLLVWIFAILGPIVFDPGTFTLDGSFIVPPELAESVSGVCAWQPAAWALLVWIFLLAPAAGLAFGQIWIVLMRKRQDFGRDYYSFALKKCAAAARLSALLSIIPAFALLWLAGHGNMPNTAEQTAADLASILLPAHAWALAALLLPLAAALSWTRVVRSATPLRHKVALLAALVFTLAAIWCTCTGLLYGISDPMQLFG